LGFVITAVESASLYCYTRQPADVNIDINKLHLHVKGKKGKVDNLYCGSIIDPIAAELLLQYPLEMWQPKHGSNEHIDMKAFARYQIILLGERELNPENNMTPKLKYIYLINFIGVNKSDKRFQIKETIKDKNEVHHLLL